MTPCSRFVVGMVDWGSGIGGDRSERAQSQRILVAQAGCESLSVGKFTSPQSGCLSRRTLGADRSREFCLRDEKDGIEPAGKGDARKDSIPPAPTYVCSEIRTCHSQYGGAQCLGSTKDCNLRAPLVQKVHLL